MDEEFVRSAGTVRKRWAGGLSGWIAEDCYCDAKRSISFPVNTIRIGHSEWNFKVAFRRIYADGICVAKYEVGITCEKGFRPEDNSGFELLLRHLLSLTVNIRQPGGSLTKCRLGEAGKFLAVLYASASNKHRWRGWLGRKSSFERKLVIAGTPAVFIDVNEWQAGESRMPNTSKEIRLKDATIKLFHWRSEHAGKWIPVWAALHGAWKYRPEVRRLRLYLLRLNAENQSLVRVLKAINSDVIKPVPRTPASDLLQDYLNRATSIILKLSDKSRDLSVGNSELLALAGAAAENFISDTERESLLRNLEALKIRKNIFRKIESQRTLQDQSLQLGLGGQGIVLNARTINIGGFHMPSLSQQQQIVLAFAFGVIFLLFSLVVALFIPSPTPFQEQSFRIATALAASGIGAVIPGILNLQLKLWSQLVIRAGGALAIFVIVYFYNPGMLTH